MTAFAPTLRRIRIAHAISQSALARLAQIDRPVLVKYETGTRTPCRETIVAIAVALEASDTERAELFAAAEFMVDLHGHTIDPDVVAFALLLAGSDETQGEKIRVAMRAVMALLAA